MNVLRHGPRAALILGLLGLAAAGGFIVAERRQADGSVQPWAAATDGPRVFVPETSFSLGSIDRPDQFTHDFTISNAGNASLRLSAAKENCDCLTLEVPSSLAPGENGTIAVRPHIRDKEKPFSGGKFIRAIKVHTNDPQTPTVELKLDAIVLRRLVASVPQVSFVLNMSDLPDVARNNRHKRLMVYSQTWNDFTLKAKSCSLEGLSYQILPPEVNDFADLDNVRGGYRLLLDLPEELPNDRLAGALELVGAAADGQEETVTVDIDMRQVGRASFFGANMTGGGTCYLGTQPERQAVRCRILMKINDEPKKLSVEKIETVPPALKVHVTRQGGESAGLYQLDLELPDTAPACGHMGEKAGYVRLTTDHPRLGTIELPVEVTLLPRGQRAKAVGCGKRAAILIKARSGGKL